jgi:alkylation response protein AidB-like acyl-CoA dehydrogenase
VDFRFSPEQEEFRRDVQRFLAETLTDEFWDQYRRRGRGSSPEFSRAAGERGWLAVAWPPDFGGKGFSYFEQMIYMEEMAEAGAPQEHHRRAVQQVGPSIILSGSDEQKRDFLPRIASGEISFAMGLSEPNAGSDLAAVQTEAVRDGDEFRVTGHKLFTSGAHYSDYLWTVCRTDPDAPKHRGISMLIVPLDAPGVTITPLLDMLGMHHINEVFMDDVHVPGRNLVGEENRGWYVNATTMDFERSGIGRIAGLRRSRDRALDDVRASPRERERLGYAARRARIAGLAVAVEVSQWLAYRVTWMQASGQIPNYQVSITKILATETGQAISHEMVGFHGPAAWLMRDRVAAPEEGGDGAGWGVNVISGIPTTIAQGTNEIQRNVIATRGLGLPRG